MARQRLAFVRYVESKDLLGPIQHFVVSKRGVSSQLGHDNSAIHQTFWNQLALYEFVYQVTMLNIRNALQEGPIAKHLSRPTLLGALHA